LGSSEPQLQRPNKSKDDTENIAKPSWQDVRGDTSTSGRQWGMCTIGCMYREQVDRGRLRTTPLWRWSRADIRSSSSSNSTSPRRDPEQGPIQKRMLVCQKGKTDGGRRAASGARCAAARPCCLADREVEGRATYREPKPGNAAVGCRGRWAPGGHQ